MAFDSPAKRENRCTPVLCFLGPLEVSGNRQKCGSRVQAFVSGFLLPYRSFFQWESSQ